MKKFFLMLLPLVTMITGCRYDDSDIWAELSDHEARIIALEKAINTDLASVQGIVSQLQNQVYVSDVTPTGNGFVLSFTNGTSFNVTNGTDGNTPVIGLKKDTDNNYYWTLNGEWMTDASGNKVRATGDQGVAGVTPQVKIENKKWMVSVDGGTTWTEAGDATVVGDSLFKSVAPDATGENIIFTFQDDTTISIPVVPQVQKLQLIFDESAILSILSGATATVDYTITGPDDETVEFDTFENNGYKVTVTPADAVSGTISVTAPDPAVKGKVLFILTGSKGSSFVKTVTINGDPTLAADQAEYSTDWKAGEITVGLRANVAYTSEIEAGKTWITAGSAPNKFNLEANTGEDNRSAEVTFKADGVADVVVTITQTGKEAIVLTATEESVIYSADELAVVINTNAVVTATPDVDWITIEEATKALEQKTFNFKLAPNTGAAREGHILFTAGETSQTVTVKQAAAPAYVLATNVEDGKYLIVAKTDDAFIAASPLEASKNYGYLNGANVIVVEKAVANRLAAAEFTIAATDGGYTICGPDGRYVYQTGTYNSFNVAANPSEGQVWSIEIDSDGLATITNNGVNKYWQYSTSFTSYGSYATAQTGGFKPSLYKLLNGDAQSLATINFGKESVSVKIGENVANAATTNSDGVVAYESSDPSVATVAADGTITGVAAGEATITASVAATDKFSAASTTCKVVVTAGYDFENIAALNALVTSTTEVEYKGNLKDVVVTFVPDTKDAFIKDATGSTLVYVTNHGFKQGQTFTGEVTVKAKLYNKLVEVTAIDATFIGDETAVAPENVTLAQLVGNYTTWQSAYVKSANLTVVSVSGKNINVKDGDNTYIVYQNAGTVTAKAGDGITATGTITKFNTTEELKVWKAADIEIASTSTTPTIEAADITGVAAAGVADATATITISNGDGWAASVTPDGTVVTAASIAGNVITYTVAANTGAAREGKITVKLAKAGNDDVTKDIKVAQLAAGGGAVEYELYSGEIVEGDYIIFYQGKAMNTTTASNRLQYLEVTPTDDIISDPDSKIVWHIAASGTSWTLYNVADSKYAVSTGTKNQGTTDAAAGEKGLWTISETGSGSKTYEIVNDFNKSKNVNANLRNNTTYGFATYGTSTGGPLSLYKKK